MVNTTSPQTKAKTHHVRTFFAAIFGTLAVWLIAASILVVWLNQTLLDTSTFASTVAPLVSSSKIQNYVATNVATQLENSTSPQQLAQTLLPPSQLQGLSPAQASTAVNTLITSSVMNVVGSPAFATQWQTVTTSAHEQFVSQLNSNTPTLSLNLRPAMVDAISDLNQTKLAPAVSQFNVPANAGQVSLAGSGLDKIHLFVRILKTATIGIVGLAILFIILAIWLSVHHRKTIQRILWTTGTGELGAAAVLSLLYVIKINNGPPTQQTAFAIAQVLVRNLRLATAIIGAICLILAIILHFMWKRSDGVNSGSSR